MTKTVVIVCDGANINGGANRVAIETAIGLKKADWNVVLFAGSGPIERELINIGVKIVCLDQIDILSDKCRTRAIIQGLWNYKAYISLYELLIGVKYYPLLFSLQFVDIKDVNYLLHYMTILLFVLMVDYSIIGLANSVDCFQCLVSV